MRRVVESGGKRSRDLFIRCGYLGLLISLTTVLLLGGGDDAGSHSLTGLAKLSDHLFKSMSYLQLGLVALLAPIFTAGAITQEKDSQTYDILLATPLTNAQILFGSLLSRMFFVLALLISGIPVFSITQIFGGVAISDIAESFGIAAATTFVTGAMAMGIATFKVGTRRTIFGFYLVNVIYLVGLYLLDKVPYFWLDGRTPGSHISWFTPFHPFLALRTIFDPEYAPPELAALPSRLRIWPIDRALSSPANFYIALMFVVSVALVLPATVLLRKMAQSSTSFRGWLLQKLRLSKGDRTQKPRVVWFNPIAWREARTKASAARAVFLRWGFTAVGIGGAIALVALFASQKSPDTYINANALGTTPSSITILGKHSGTYPLAPDFQVKYNDATVAPGALRGRLEVVESSILKKSVLTMSTDGGTLLRDQAGKPVMHDQISSLALREPERRLSAKELRLWLLGAIIVEFAVILLVVTNAAASTVTREKEDGTLDLLLTTPITSRYYIWGKLRGLVAFIAPLAAVPVMSLGVVVVYDLFRRLTSNATTFEWLVFPEGVLVMPFTLLLVSAFAAILGMQLSLRFRTTVLAVMSSIGIVAGACFGLGYCGFMLASRGGRMAQSELFFAAFSPFTLIQMMIDPREIQADWGAVSDDIAFSRFLVFLAGLIAAGLYGLLVWTMYKSMVKNFDMTIRRQSR